MRKQQITGWCMLAVLGCSMVNPVLGYPSVVTAAHLPDNSDWKPYAPAPVPAPAPDAAPEARKFAEKPNASKKVIALEDRNDIDDIQTNQISDAGFSWSNMLAMVMQMLFNPIGSQQVGPNKSDSIDTDQGISPSPWANLLTMGLKILTAILGGGGAPQGDGIDKVDNSSPMQGILAAVLSAVVGSKDPDQVATMAKQAGEFINIVVNLLDALKTSFSHRSIAARSIGRKDSVSEAAVASLSLLKGYVRTMKTTDDNCHEKYICEANNECANSMNGSSTIYCQLSTYAASFLLQRTGEAPFDKFYEAGRRGRSGDDCRQLYLTCNEV
ncbi:uncharacterized protein LOC128988186 isoform X1 [Macrosteles quadrilineatus]|uniref:uncharacterized protein LOC128982142 isoform X1 n=1 Tax=Macrosteles quadrilineatus TaxID=74068 RepID=UPI0023E1CF04|nr:uncharacterized protein LOC128982142 isoform X1 [Macrosteles quadrilineatus]XP_054265407.1 uncharacterized protein LOC128988186 isoform X1 [Macrosteles quadrilineatus]